MRQNFYLIEFMAPFKSSLPFIVSYFIHDRNDFPQLKPKVGFGKPASVMKETTVHYFGRNMKSVEFINNSCTFFK